MRAHDHDGDQEPLRPKPARADDTTGVQLLAAPPIAAPVLSPGSVLRLQRLAGNQATAAALANPALAVQRCGPDPCDCGPEERAEKEAAMGHDPGAATPAHD